MMATKLSTNDSDEEWETDEEAQTEAQALDDKGLPAAGPYAKVNPAILYPIMMLVFVGLGYLIAWGIYSASTQSTASEKKFDAKFAMLATFVLQYLYLAVFVLAQVLPIQQIFVAFHRKQAKVENPDQYIFKTMLKNDPYVRLETEGPVGAFNRAQRGIDNTREMFVGFVLNLVFAGFVFPEAALALSLLFLVGRIAYSAGYIGSSRTPGQILSMLAGVTTTGLQLFATVQIYKAA